MIFYTYLMLLKMINFLKTTCFPHLCMPLVNLKQNYTHFSQIHNSKGHVPLQGYSNISLIFDIHKLQTLTDGGVFLLQPKGEFLQNLLIPQFIHILSPQRSIINQYTHYSLWNTLGCQLHGNVFLKKQLFSLILDQLLEGKMTEILHCFANSATAFFNEFPHRVTDRKPCPSLFSSVLGST